MTNEEISKWLMNLKDDIGKTQYQPLWHYAEALDMAIEALEQTQWIPCSERLPKIEENPVLVTSMGMVGMGWYRNGDWLTSTNLPFFDVVAWMPLPEPWKGEEK